MKEQRSSPHTATSQERDQELKPIHHKPPRKPVKFGEVAETDWDQIALCASQNSNDTPQIHKNPLDRIQMQSNISLALTLSLSLSSNMSIS